MPVQLVYITAALLFLDLFPMPGGYHTILTVMAGGTFAWGTYVNSLKKIPLLVLVYALFTILYNPVMEIELNRQLWIFADLAAGIILLATKDHILH
jgi:hypothetical protein